VLLIVSGLARATAGVVVPDLLDRALALVSAGIEAPC
jgi:hypothetical protein